MRAALRQGTCLLTLLIILQAVFLRAADAQEAKPDGRRAAAPPAVAVASMAGRVRFVAPGGAVVEMRLEVFSPAGEKLFDSGFKGGNVLDWPAADDAQPPSQGEAYLCVVTLRTLSGRLGQRHGLVTFQAGQAVPRGGGRAELPPAQAVAWGNSRVTQGLAPLEREGDDSPITILADGAPPPVTLTSHDGREGQVTSTTGALTFRTGDLFSGKDREAMRITEDGRIGIGTDKPKAALDVTGEIRAGGGIRFADGTVMTSAGKLKGAGQSTTPGTPTSTDGISNTFVGRNAGLSNTVENDNTFVGSSSDGAAGVTNATAIGHRAKVTQSNSLVLGSIAGVNSATADTKVGIGTTAPAARLQGRLTEHEARLAALEQSVKLNGAAARPGQQKPRARATRVRTAASRSRR